jgi:N4-gp56 family major capsid protein
MSNTTYGVNDPLAVKAWAKKLFTEALKSTSVSPYMGKTSSAVIQIRDELDKGPGDRITVGLRMQLTGDGVQADGTLEGNEEALATYSDNVFINQLRHAVRSAGKMSEARIPFKVREEARVGLQDWWTNRIETSFFNQICGFTAQTDTRYTGNNAVTAPTSVIRAGAVANDQSLAASFSLDLIDRAVERAYTQTTPIRPIKVNGEDKFVCFLHDSQITSLRTSASSGQWLDIQKAAMAGSKASDNPIFTGALGEYNGVILRRNNRVTQGQNSSTGVAVANTRRAVLVGAQAATMAYGGENGQEMSWVEELFDYNNQLGVSGGMIFGIKKNVFNSLDFSTIVIASSATPA